MCTNCGLAAAVVGGGGGAAARSAPTPTPDTRNTTTVFRGGTVYTLDPRLPWAQAVAVRGRDIIAVGSDDEVSAVTGPDARIIELAGRMVLPGFVEGHIHPLVGGFMTSGVDLQLPTREAALSAIAEYARAHPTGPVRGFGWRVDMFGPEGPHRADLDAIIPDRPAFFFAIDAHSLWVNSATLKAAGVSRDSHDPQPGFSYYARDQSGEPTGFVLEMAAVLPMIHAVEPMTKDLLARLFADWLPQAAAAGITSVFDAGMPPVGGDPAGLASVYTDLESAGGLPFRVVVSHLVKGPPIDDAVADAQRLTASLGTELVRGGVLKILGDGTVEGRTACLLQPYTDKPDETGQSPFTEDEWHRLVGAADLAGLDIHVHAIGDRTIRLALDALEAAIRTNPARDRRHTIAHLQIVDDADQARFGELGVYAQFSANWLSADPGTVDTTIHRCGVERQRKTFRPKSILDRGGTVTFGTDWPAAGWFSTYRPLDSIQVAVTRQLVGDPDGPVLDPAGERLDLADAVYANTLGAARQLRLDDLVGSLQPGKRADLVVLGQNIFEVPPHDIAATPIDMTMMDGRFTHGDDDD